MAPTLPQQKQKRKEETRKRKTSNQSKGSSVGSSIRERADSQTPKKRKRQAVIESDDKDDKKLRRTKSSDSDSQSTDNIEKIIAKRVDDDGSVYYIVRWKNYPPEADSEEPASNVDAPELIRQFEQEQQKLRKRSFEKNTSSSQLPTTSRSARPTSTLRNKVVVKNVAKTPQKGSTSLPREKSASANPPLQKSAQKHPFDTVTKSPSKSDVPNVLTSRTPVEELPSVHADNSSNVSNVQSKPSKNKAPVRLTTPMMSVRKEAIARSNNGLFLLGKKKFETTAGLHPKERMLRQERREREVQAIREKRMSTENAFDPHPEAPTPQKICSTSIVFEQPTAASAKPLKAKLVPPSLPKKRASTNSLESDRFTESILPIAKKESTSTTVASIRPGLGISSSVKSSLSKEKQSKTNERTSTPSEPQDYRMLNGEASTAISVSLTRQEANLSVTKTIRKDVKASVTQSLQSVTTRATNDGDNSQLSESQIDIIKREMDEVNATHREEEHWRRGKEQKRQESLAERIQGAEEKKKLEAQKSAKASKKTERIYDPRAVSPSNNDDEIFDPRAVKNHEASTNVSLQRKNPPSLPSCLLDRGIKIEKIMKLFFVKNELVGLCKYKNCLVMQIVTVEKIKEVDPQALLRAYEPLFWDTQTNE
ncbi:unnamed protein product, partial [Mesorhabditis belari]|uniref:Chromo domain-containing protein n=1 Tax=Mesorhabditis belari TaxID=2138241 RepID=A0AAF3FDC6_9BILA